MDLAPMLFWGEMPTDGEEHQLLYSGPNGENLAWATLETRVMIERLPTVGTRIQSFGAATAIADKTMQTSMWVYDLDGADQADELIAAFDIASVMFNIDARRAFPIPDDLRTEQVARFHPALGSIVRSV